MSGSSSTISSSEPRIGALRIQQSSYGLTLPIIWGRTRISGNLGWYGDFTATPNTTTTESGGKGGGGIKQQNTTYTYSAAVMMMLAEGPLLGVRSAWKGKQQFTGANVTSKITQSVETFVLNNIPSPIATVANHSDFISDINVEQFHPGGFDGITESWDPLINGVDYSVTAGVYTFTADAAAQTVRITYTYTETIASVSALGQIGLSFASGYPAQPVWGYLTSNHPDQAVGYSGVAYVYGSGYALTGNAEVDNHTFEVDSILQFSNTIPDSNPADIAMDFLVNPQYGAEFGRANIGDMTAYYNCCTAQGIFLSPALVEQKPAIEFLKDLADTTNCGLVWSEGLLKFIPYCDSPVTGNGITYTPDTSPIYDLTDDDFLPDGSDGPIHITRKSPADSYNRVQIEFLNRDNQYNVEICEAKDQANIEAFGLRSMNVVNMHWICDPAIAKIVAQLILQRALYVRNKYEFKLGWKYITLEPMDLVTLTDSGLGLYYDPVRIVEITEDPDGALSIIAEDFPHGSASATRYPSQSGSGFSHDYNITPGNVTVPVIFQAPRELSVKDTGLDIWVAVGGGDNYGGCEIWASIDDSTYKKFGVLNGKSRYGTLTQTMGSQATAGQYAQTMSVHLLSGGQLLSGTQNDLDLLNTLCYVDGEYLAYKDAALTGADAYTLSTLNRGAYSSGQAAHVSGTQFVRCDDGIAKLALPAEYVDKTVYLKFLAFNKYSGATQALEDVTAYTYSIDGRFIRLAPPNVTSFTATGGKLQIILHWVFGPVHYNSKVEIWGGLSTLLSDAAKLSDISYPTSTWTHIGLGTGVTVNYWIRVVDDKGNASEFSSRVSANSGTLTAEDIANGILNTAKFAAGIEPISLVSSLPPTSGYTGPSVVFLTSDGKIYRLVSGAWTAVVPATDIAGQITSTQISDGSISSPKIIAGSITSDKIAGGAVTANSLAANSIIAGKIAAGAISSTEIAAGAIVASKLAASNLITLSAQIANGIILTANIGDANITTLKVANNAITIPVGAVTSGGFPAQCSMTLAQAAKVQIIGIINFGNNTGSAQSVFVGVGISGGGAGGVFGTVGVSISAGYSGSLSTSTIFTLGGGSTYTFTLSPTLNGCDLMATSIIAIGIMK